MIRINNEILITKTYLNNILLIESNVSKKIINVNNNKVIDLNNLNYLLRKCLYNFGFNEKNSL